MVPQVDFFCNSQWKGEKGRGGERALKRREDTPPPKLHSQEKRSLRKSRPSLETSKYWRRRLKKKTSGLESTSILIHLLTFLKGPENSLNFIRLLEKLTSCMNYGLNYEIGNLKSQRWRVQFAFQSILFQRLSNVWEIISDVDSTLNKRRFAAGYYTNNECLFVQW
jgi:hypothetical protein